MKRITFLLSILFIAQLVFGQEKLSQEKVQIGVPYPVVDAGIKKYFTYKNLIISVKVDRGKFFLQTYNTDKLTLEKVAVFEDFPRGFRIEKFIELKDRIFILYSLWDRATEKEKFFTREIDPLKCSFVEKGKKLLEVSGKISSRFSCLTSHDKGKLFIQYRNKAKFRNDSKNKDVIGMWVYDDNLQKLWGGDIEMPYTEEKMDNLQYTINSDGDVFLLAIVRDLDAAPVLSERRLIKFAGPNADITEKVINFPEGKSGGNLSFFEDGTGSLVLAGYSGTTEVAKINLGKGDGDFQFDYYDIPLDIINLNLKARKVKKNNKKESKNKTVGLSNLVPTNLYLHNDGSMVVVGEQYHVVVHTSTDANGNTRTTYTYHYDDILVTKINKDGSLAWMRKLPKRQHGKKPQGSMSFKLIEGVDDLYFVYMDNIKNLGLGDDDEPVRHADGKGGFLTAYKVGYETGSVKRISLLDSRNIKEMKMYQFKLSRISSVTPDEFVFEVYKKKKEDVLIKVELK